MIRLRDYPDYAVTPNGTVVSYRVHSEGREMSPSVSTGYAKVSLVDKSGETRNVQVHRLVAMQYIKNPKKLEIVNHLDGDKLNNDVSNLEWTTRKGNGEHAGQKLYPAQAAARKARKEEDMRARLSIVAHAHSACTANPELFYSIYSTVMHND